MMIEYTYIYPSIFVETLLVLLLSKYIQFSPNYGLSISGAIFTGLSVLDLIPNLTRNDKYISLISIYLIYMIESYIQYRNQIKSMSLWTNCLNVSMFGVLSGVCFFQKNMYISVLISIFSTSYALGNRYIEYTTNYKDKVPILLYALSTPIGVYLSYYIPSDMSINGLASGIFFSYGLLNVVDSFKNKNTHPSKTYYLLLLF